MRRAILLSFYILTCGLCVTAQDAKYAGTWKWHFDSPYDGDEGPAPRDEYIRIDIEDGYVNVRYKIVGKYYNGSPLEDRKEGENVTVNSDGSISFDIYLSRKEYDNDDRLYWTVWYHYDVKREGVRLKVYEKLISEAFSSGGVLVKENKKGSPNLKVFYNEKDNW